MINQIKQNSSGNGSFRYSIINIPSLAMRADQSQLDHNKERSLTPLYMICIAIKIHNDIFDLYHK